MGRLRRGENLALEDSDHRNLKSRIFNVKNGENVPKV
jgi:hypothetical protein